MYDRFISGESICITPEWVHSFYGEQYNIDNQDRAYGGDALILLNNIKNDDENII